MIEQIPLSLKNYETSRMNTCVFIIRRRNSASLW